jgi:chemotaxis protein CheC
MGEELILSDMHLDILKEMANIGAGNSATALSELINKRVNMNVPEVRVVPFNELDEAVGGVETLVAGIYMEFTGEIDGTIIFILDSSSAFNMKSFFKDIPGISLEKDISEFDVSFFKEVGNILAGAYLKALNGLTGLQAKHSVPLFAYDMIGAIMSVPFIEFGKIGEQAVFIDTEFTEGSKIVKGHFFIIPEYHAFSKILEAIGVE